MGSGVDYTWTEAHGGYELTLRTSTFGVNYGVDLRIFLHHVSEDRLRDFCVPEPGWYVQCYPYPFTLNTALSIDPSSDVQAAQDEVLSTIIDRLETDVEILQEARFHLRFSKESK